MDPSNPSLNPTVNLKSPSDGLSPGDFIARSIDSPGSSVFDLPVNTISAGYVVSRPSVPTLHQPSDTRELSENAENKLLRDTSYLVVSGGTGCNSICSAFKDACYVLPVSDDGGSSSEIIRVIGGPSIGDIRSRLVRLIPAAPPDSPLDKIRNLLAYRLNPRNSERECRDEWRDIVEGNSRLWSGIPSDRKEVIRGFLVYFENEVLRRAHKSFSFQNGSIGNYFLAAAGLFFRSLPSAIFLFSSITGSEANILPVLVTNHTVTIGAELEDGSNLVGQCNISHPANSTGVPSIELSPPEDALHEAKPASINAVFEKDVQQPLSSRIKRIYYINAHGHEIHPASNPEFLANLRSREVLLYSCGSLWTSIMPCLALRGLASVIAGSRTLKAKILLLNSRNDRETGGYTAVDYINAITNTLNSHHLDKSAGQPGRQGQPYPVSAFITHLVYLRDGQVALDEKAMADMGIRCVEVGCSGGLGLNGAPLFDAECVQQALRVILDEQSTCHP